MRSSVSICLDKRRKSTTGQNKNKYPIKIKVNFKVREAKKNKYLVRRYPTGIYCMEDQFSKAKKNSTVILAQAKAINLYEKRLSVEEFERLYNGAGALEDIKSVFEYVITKLRDEERDGTADAYHQALSSFTRYKGEYISFQSVTVAWLKAYERWMRTERIEKDDDGNDVVIHPKSINTVGIYCRALRTIFNMAAELNIITRDSSPFGVRKYVIPSGRRLVRKALSKEERNIVFRHRSERADVNRALDLWVYQYCCNGCNMADVAYLQYRNIDGEYLSFDRKKTQNTERNKAPIELYINERMREVIMRHGNKSLDPSEYVFPILRQGLTSKQRKKTIHQFIKETNELLAIAQQEINKDSVRLKIKLTSGTARYSTATILKKQGLTLSDIAKALGHGSESTTEHYTEEEREALKKISRALTSDL